MGNEKTHKNIASLASKILSGKKKPTSRDAIKMAGSLLTQAPDHKRKKRS